MTDEQLAARARDGDHLAFAALAHRYRPVMRHYTRNVFARGLDQTDFDQEAAIGLWEAVCGYDPERGFRFTTLANVIIKRRLNDTVKWTLREKRAGALTNLSLDEPVSNDDDEMPLYGAIEDRSCPDPAVALARKESLADVVRVINTELSDLEREAVVGLMNGETYMETLGRLGRPTSGVRRNGQPRPKAIENAVDRARRKVLAALEAAA
jgi:RNA polymerase sigma-H factor